MTMALLCLLRKKKNFGKEIRNLPKLFVKEDITFKYVMAVGILLKILKVEINQHRIFIIMLKNIF